MAEATISILVYFVIFLRISYFLLFICTCLQSGLDISKMIIYKRRQEAKQKRRERRAERRAKRQARKEVMYNVSTVT